MKAPSLYKRACDFARSFVHERRSEWSHERLIYLVRSALVRFERASWTTVTEDPATLPPGDATRLLVIVDARHLDEHDSVSTHREVVAITRIAWPNDRYGPWHAGRPVVVFRRADATPSMLVALAWRPFPDIIDLDPAP